MIVEVLSCNSLGCILKSSLWPVFKIILLDPVEEWWYKKAAFSGETNLVGENEVVELAYTDLVGKLGSLSRS